MDIKKLAFKYADKVVLGVTALILVLAIIHSPMFEDSMRPLRETVSAATSLIWTQEEFNLAQLQKDVRKYEEDIKKKLETSQPVKTEPAELKIPEDLETAPPAAIELRAQQWGPSKDIFEPPINVTAGVPSTVSLKENLARGSIKVTRNPELVRVAPKGDRELEVVGKSEGEGEFEWRDAGNVRHVMGVKIAKYIEKPQVYPPAKLTAAMEGASVKLAWDPPSNVDSRAPVAKYHVYRRKADEAKPNPITVVNAVEGKAGGTYLDNSVEFDAKYVYTVKSASPTAESVESKDASPAAEVEIPGDSDFFVKGVTPKNVSVKVYKLINKEWKTRSYYSLTPGEPIGSVAQIRSGKTVETLDFRTGATLVDFDHNASRLRVSIMSMPVKTDKGGVETVDRATTMPDPYKGKIVYLDKRGELKEKWMGRENLEELDKRFPGITVLSAARKAADKDKEGADEAPAAPTELKREELKPQTVQ